MNESRWIYIIWIRRSGFIIWKWIWTKDIWDSRNEQLIPCPDMERKKENESWRWIKSDTIIFDDWDWNLIMNQYRFEIVSSYICDRAQNEFTTKKFLLSGQKNYTIHSSRNDFSSWVLSRPWARQSFLQLFPECRLVSGSVGQPFSYKFARSCVPLFLYSVEMPAIAALHSVLSLCTRGIDIG